MAMFEFTGTVRTDSEIIRTKADQAKNMIADYQDALNAFLNAMRNSTDEWQGEGGDAFRATIEEALTKIQNTLTEYSKYPDDLLRNAGIYRDTITETNVTATGLDNFTMQ
jgi:WXG100 family type VII secretion target